MNHEGARRDNNEPSLGHLLSATNLHTSLVQSAVSFLLLPFFQCHMTFALRNVRK